MTFWSFTLEVSEKASRAAAQVATDLQQRNASMSRSIATTGSLQEQESNHLTSSQLLFWDQCLCQSMVLQFQQLCSVLPLAEATLAVVHDGVDIPHLPRQPHSKLVVCSPGCHLQASHVP
jgi:hypothetical protein